MKPSRHQNHPQRFQDGSQSIRFEFTHPTATSVCLAGTFNEWSPVSNPLHPLGGGRWIKNTHLQPGTYEYCLVVDGQWMSDPQAKESVSNPFGGRNSLLQVDSIPEDAHPVGA